MSVTIIDVSDSFTSRDFAAVRIGAKRFKPDERRSTTLAGMVMTFSPRARVYAGAVFMEAVRLLGGAEVNLLGWTRLA
jgi:hypothetical protein